MFRASFERVRFRIRMALRRGAGRDEYPVRRGRRIRYRWSGRASAPGSSRWSRGGVSAFPGSGSRHRPGSYRAMSFLVISPYGAVGEEVGLLTLFAAYLA